MSMPRRARRWLALVGLATLATPVGARELKAIADGFLSPIGVAARNLYEGADRVLVADKTAESGGVLHDFRIVAGRVAGRSTVEGVPPGALAWAEESLLIGSNTIYARPAQIEGDATSGARPPGVEIVLGTPTATARFVFAVDRGGGRLWRTRRVGDLFTNLRAVERENVAGRLLDAVISPQGYLVTLANAPTGAMLLQFRDPEQPEIATASLPLSGVRAPIALAYGVAGRLQEAPLYALADDGVYRIDTSGDTASAACEAKRVARVENATAFAIGSDGGIYVTTNKGELLFSEDQR